MAFDEKEFDLNGTGSKGGAKFSVYSTPDALSAVAASGYFNAQEANIKTGDFICVFSSNGGDDAAIYHMVNTAGVITVGGTAAFA